MSCVCPILGGIINNELSDAMWTFCCKEKRWTRGKSLIVARAKHSSVVMHGMLYLSGGVRMDENQTVNPMTEIHSYNIKTGIWRRVGRSNTPKVDGTLLGIDNILYELGGQSDGGYTRTMETYTVTSDGLVTRTDEHYVLPCVGNPGPLRATLHGKNQIIILWENTGDILCLNIDDGRCYPVDHTLKNLTGCLVAFNRQAYIMGGVGVGIGIDNAKSCTESRVVDFGVNSYKHISLPPGLVVQRCVRVTM